MPLPHEFNLTSYKGYLTFEKKNANVLYQNLDLTQSKVYYSNAINQFCMS